MDNEYDFNPEDISTIILHTLVDSFAFQQAAVSVILDRLNLSEREKDEICKEINSQKPFEKEKILQTLFVTFGKTPDTR